MHLQAVQLSEDIDAEMWREEEALLMRGSSSGRQCLDQALHCGDWAAKGECKRNPGFMEDNCRKACGFCEAAEAGDDDEGGSTASDEGESTSKEEL